MTSLTTVTKQVSDLIEPILDELGFVLVDTEYQTDRGRWVLRLYIDKEGGVTIDDCAKVSNELGDLIDIKDIIENEYVLEVSSPGLNRPLKKEADFIRVTGKKVKVRTKAPLKGQRNFMGVLKDFKEHKLYIQSEGQLITVAWADIEKANLVYEFDD